VQVLAALDVERTGEAPLGDRHEVVEVEGSTGTVASLLSAVSSDPSRLREKG
jgi:hypothetical protein